MHPSRTGKTPTHPAQTPVKLSDPTRARPTSPSRAPCAPHKPQLRFATRGLAAAGRRGADGKLGSAQAALLLQEETLRRGERERRALLEKVSALERSLHAAEGERRSAQVGTWVKTPPPLPPRPGCMRAARSLACKMQTNCRRAACQLVHKLLCEMLANRV